MTTDPTIAMPAFDETDAEPTHDPIRPRWGRRLALGAAVTALTFTSAFAAGNAIGGDASGPRAAAETTPATDGPGGYAPGGVVRPADGLVAPTTPTTTPSATAPALPVAPPAADPQAGPAVLEVPEVIQLDPDVLVAVIPVANTGESPLSFAIQAGGVPVSPSVGTLDPGETVEVSVSALGVMLGQPPAGPFQRKVYVESSAGDQLVTINGEVIGEVEIVAPTVVEAPWGATSVELVIQNTGNGSALVDFSDNGLLLSQQSWDAGPESTLALTATLCGNPPLALNFPPHELERTITVDWSDTEPAKQITVVFTLPQAAKGPICDGLIFINPVLINP